MLQACTVTAVETPCSYTFDRPSGLLPNDRGDDDRNGIPVSMLDTDKDYASLIEGRQPTNEPRWLGETTRRGDTTAEKLAPSWFLSNSIYFDWQPGFVGECPCFPKTTQLRTRALGGLKIQATEGRGGGGAARQLSTRKFTVV